MKPVLPLSATAMTSAQLEPAEAEIAAVGATRLKIPKGVPTGLFPFWEEIKSEFILLSEQDVPEITHDDVVDEMKQIIVSLLASLSREFVAEQGRPLARDIQRGKGKARWPTSDKKFIEGKATLKVIERVAQGLIDTLFYAASPGTAVQDRRQPQNAIALLEGSPPAMRIASSSTQNSDPSSILEPYVSKTEALNADQQARFRIRESGSNRVERLIVISAIGSFFRPYYWKARTHRDGKGTVVFDRPTEEGGVWPGKVRPSDADLIISRTIRYPGPNPELWLDIRTEEGKIVFQQVVRDMVHLADNQDPEYLDLYGTEGEGYSQRQTSGSYTEGSISVGSSGSGVSVSSDTDFEPGCHHTAPVGSPAKIRSRTSAMAAADQMAGVGPDPGHEVEQDLEGAEEPGAGDDVMRRTGQETGQEDTFAAEGGEH
jgi:hypothetical protein